MVFVAQSEECLIVIQEVVGSKPTIHPNNAHIVQLDRTLGYEPWNRSSNLFEGTNAFIVQLNRTSPF